MKPDENSTQSVTTTPYVQKHLHTQVTQPLESSHSIITQLLVYSKKATSPSTVDNPSPAPAAAREAPPVKIGDEGVVAEPEADDEALPWPIASAEEGRGITGVGEEPPRTTELEEPVTAGEETGEEAGEDSGLGLGLTSGVLTGTWTGMVEEGTGVELLLFC